MAMMVLQTAKETPPPNSRADRGDQRRPSSLVAVFRRFPLGRSAVLGCSVEPVIRRAPVEPLKGSLM
jgi:hypothetical protein